MRVPGWAPRTFRGDQRDRFHPHRRAEEHPRARARVCRPRDPPGCLGLRPGWHLAPGDHREGLEARSHEHPPAAGVRRPRAERAGRLSRRGGARVGMLGDRHLSLLQRPRDGADPARRIGEAQARVPGASGAGAAARLLLPDRAGRRLRRRGDRWVINGSKCFITNGEYANWYTVYAKTDPDAGHRGISCFIVPRDAGVVVDKHEDKMGQRASNTATVTFPEVEIPLDHLVGEENKGFKIAMMTLDRTRPGVAAMATGVARAAMEFAIEYAKQRVQFGVPIAMHQAIQFMIADMATKVHLARLASWNSAVLLDQGKRNTLESSHAKRYAADI